MVRIRLHKFSKISVTKSSFKGVPSRYTLNLSNEISQKHRIAQYVTKIEQTNTLLLCKCSPFTLPRHPLPTLARHPCQHASTRPRRPKQPTQAHYPSRACKHATHATQVSTPLTPPTKARYPRHSCQHKQRAISQARSIW